MGIPRKYLPMDELSDKERLMDMMLPNDKPLGKCTGAELEMVGLTYLKLDALLQRRV
jgi:hypothetical protein